MCKHKCNLRQNQYVLDFNCVFAVVTDGRIKITVQRNRHHNHERYARVNTRTPTSAPAPSLPFPSTVGGSCTYKIYNIYIFLLLYIHNAHTSTNVLSHTYTYTYTYTDTLTHALSQLHTNTNEYNQTARTLTNKCKRMPTNITQTHSKHSQTFMMQYP